MNKIKTLKNRKNNEVTKGLFIRNSLLAMVFLYCSETLPDDYFNVIQAEGAHPL